MGGFRFFLPHDRPRPLRAPTRPSSCFMSSSFTFGRTLPPGPNRNLSRTHPGPLFYKFLASPPPQPPPYPPLPCAARHHRPRTPLPSVCIRMHPWFSILPNKPIPSVPLCLLASRRSAQHALECSPRAPGALRRRSIVHLGFFFLPFAPEPPKTSQNPRFPPPIRNKSHPARRFRSASEAPPGARGVLARCSRSPMQARNGQR